MTSERRILKVVYGGTNMASIRPIAKPSQESKGTVPVEQPEIDVLMRRFFDQSRGELDNAVPSEPSAFSATSPRNFNMAAEILDRASQAFDVLIGRCQRLEHDLEHETERASAHAGAQNEAIEQWKRLASGLKVQIDGLDRDISTLKRRSDAAEARAIKAEQKAAALQQAATQAIEHAASAERLSTKLHDKVVTAFGLGSRAHPVLEAVATQTAAE